MSGRVAGGSVDKGKATYRMFASLTQQDGAILRLLFDQPAEPPAVVRVRDRGGHEMEVPVPLALVALVSAERARRGVERGLLCV